MISSRNRKRRCFSLLLGQGKLDQLIGACGHHLPDLLAPGEGAEMFATEGEPSGHPDEMPKVAAGPSKRWSPI